MNGTKSDSDICLKEDVAAYLDGELDSPSTARFEDHVSNCAACSEELNEQKRLLLEIELAVGDRKSFELPRDFAQVVAANAQADFSGLRSQSEHRLAFRICALLLFSAVILLGRSAMNDRVVRPGIALLRGVGEAVEFFGNLVFDIAAGAVIITRFLAAYFVLNSHPLSTFVYLILAVAVAVLPCLLVRYHRTRIAEY